MPKPNQEPVPSQSDSSYEQPASVPEGILGSDGDLVDARVNQGVGNYLTARQKVLGKEQAQRYEGAPGPSGYRESRGQIDSKDKSKLSSTGKMKADEAPAGEVSQAEQNNLSGQMTEEEKAAGLPGLLEAKRILGLK